MTARTIVVPFADPADFDRATPAAVAQLRRDGILAHPTETVYGFGSSLHPAALARLSSLKPRAHDKPFLLLIADIAMLEGTGELAGSARQLAAAHWPGPLTLIVRGLRKLPPSAQGARGTVAVRWTSHPGLQRIIRDWGAPITSTSANRTGLPTASTAQEIASEWRREVERGDLVILDGGSVISATPSTIVDCTGDAPRLVRQGAISAAMVRATVHDLVGEG